MIYTLAKKTAVLLAAVILSAYCNAHALFDQEVVLYNPNKSKVRVKVDIFGEVTEIYKNYQWVPLKDYPKAKKQYQHLYELQKDRIERKKNEPKKPSPYKKIEKEPA